MVWPDRLRRVNFTNPLNGRRWLQLLAPDPRHGIRFQPDLDLAKPELGFSFRSNRLGLRGPMATDAPHVLLGTSFAMGLSVDNGDNWYEQLLEPGQWFNAAMPVGPQNQIRVLDDLYTGRGETLLYVYHPNVWKTAQGYLTADRTGRDIFSVMRWKADRASTLKLLPRWLAKEVAKTGSGLAHYARIGGEPWYFNAGYCHLDLAAQTGLFEEVMGHFNALFARFDKVVALRVPIKEELAAERGWSQQLQTLASGYDAFWNAFAGRVAGHVITAALPRDAFEFGDFLPYDTHWSARGNATFCRLAQPILRSAGVTGLIGHG